jgi:hypothetical protein
MSKEKNKYGLSRHVPADVALEIRQKSKFGCVICRNAIYTYEHINPVFVEAKVHDSTKMCLLCPNHQTESTSGRLPKNAIINAYEKVQKMDFTEKPKRFGFFNLYNKDPIVKFGSSSFQGYPSIVNADGINLLSIKVSDESICGFAINGLFLDETGTELFRIVDNEWIGNIEAWDVDIVSNSLKIRRKKGEIIFKCEISNTDNSIEITHLNMWASPFHIVVKNGDLIVGQYDLIHKSNIYYGIEADFQYGKCGMYLDSTSKMRLAAGLLRFYGGSSFISGTGITLGRGGGRAWIRKVWVSVSKNCSSLIEVKTPVRVEPQVFVIGTLDIKNVKYPDWEENEYYLNGHRLNSKPYSWGVLEQKSDSNLSIELFHISSNEKVDFERMEGFVGYWADDILDQPWADRVFECYVKAIDEEFGSEYQKRIKMYKVNMSEIIEESTPHTKKWIPPHCFSGVPLWKNSK